MAKVGQSGEGGTSGEGGASGEGGTNGEMGQSGEIGQNGLTNIIKSKHEIFCEDSHFEALFLKH